MAEITFHIKKGGATKAEVTGVKGGGCHDLAAPYYEKMLGVKKEETPTEEAYETEHEGEQEYESQ